MKVYCQNFKKHDPNFDKPFKIFGQILNSMGPTPILCEVRTELSGVEFFCPVCKEFVNIGPQRFASWGPIESRAGWPKSMIRKM